MKTVTALLWAGLAMLAGAILDAVITVFVFKKYGGCPMATRHKGVPVYRNIKNTEEIKLA